jgi:hypothetical protein
MGLQVLGSGSSSTAAHENELTVLDARLGWRSRGTVRLDVEQQLSPPKIPDASTIPLVSHSPEGTGMLFRPGRFPSAARVSEATTEVPSFSLNCHTLRQSV